MKKILVWEVQSYIGGGQKISLQIAEILKKRYEVMFIIPKEGKVSERLKKMGINFMRVPTYPMSKGKKKLKDIWVYFFYSFKKIFTIVNVIKKMKFDLLYVPGPSAMPLGAIVGLITGIPVIWHIHHIFEDKNTIKLLEKSAQIKAVKRILAVTDIAGNQISKAHEKIYTLYNSVDITCFYKIDVLEKKNELGVKKNEFIIAQVGFIQPQKDQIRAVKIVKKLCDAGYKINLLIIGEAREEDIPYKKQVIELIYQLKLEKNIKLLGYREDINEVLQICDCVMVLMSLEGFSLAALEGMAAHLPVVAIDEGGVSEIVRKSNAGILIKNDKLFIDNVSDAIQSLIENKEKAVEFGINGYQFAKEHSIDKFERNVLKAFEIFELE